jgi:hypothetical protein
MTTRTLVMMSALLEGATGIGLIANPGVVVNLLVGGSLSMGGVAVGRVGGFGLLSLALACWPSRGSVTAQVAVALFTYNLLAASYLGYLGVGGHVGYLLWTACALHALSTLLLSSPAYVALRSTGVSPI